MSVATDQEVEVKVKNKIKEPSMYNVIYLNDDKTTMEFVIESLMTYFNYNTNDAKEKMIEIHEHGSAIVGCYPFEIAEQKGVEVTLDARSQGYPLQVKIEKN